MTRDEHLQWAKSRAHEYVNAGDLPNAVASMSSDLRKHPELGTPATAMMAAIGIFTVANEGADAVRRWIDGFN